MRLCLHFVLFAFVALAGMGPQLTQVQAIYILPMGGGMDQFLANRLSRMGKFNIVADPQTADAILTDRLGETFEKKLDELYPRPADPDKDDDDDKDKKDPEQMRSTSFGRGRGTFFIVDRKTRNVLWSVYERPKNTSSDELNKVAERIVNHLKRDLKPPTQ
jgi:hypothetical protein